MVTFVHEGRVGLANDLWDVRTCHPSTSSGLSILAASASVAVALEGGTGLAAEFNGPLFYRTKQII